MNNFPTLGRAHVTFAQRASNVHLLRYHLCHARPATIQTREMAFAQCAQPARPAMPLQQPPSLALQASMQPRVPPTAVSVPWGMHAQLPPSYPSPAPQVPTQLRGAPPARIVPSECSVQRRLSMDHIAVLQASIRFRRVKHLAKPALLASAALTLPCSQYHARRALSASVMRRAASSAPLAITVRQIARPQSYARSRNGHWRASRSARTA